MPEAYEAYRRTKLESGQLYQDFVVDLLFRTIGLVVVQYTSKFYQQAVGESRTGVEIKHDEKYAKTGNFWIETAEKARPRAGDYVASGIYRDDNTWLYVIGNYDVVVGLPKVFLRGLAESGRYAIRENNTLTSKGFLLPWNQAQRYAAFVLLPKAEQKVAKAVKDLAQMGRALHALVLADKSQASLFERWTAEAS